MTADIGHQWGADLELGPTGDLGIVVSSVAGSQRILRRLLTNPGDYIWNLGYGAGLARFVGQPTPAGQIAAIIRSQLSEERVVARYPEPVVTMAKDNGGKPGAFNASISYHESASGTPNAVTVPIMG